jgi:hypothetical protein
VAPDDLSDVTLGNGHFDSGGICAIDDLEADGIHVINDIHDEILNQVRNAVREQGLGIGALDDLIEFGVDLRRHLGLLLGSLSSLGLLGQLLLGLLGLGGSLLALVSGLHQSGDGIGELSALDLPVSDLLKIEADGLGGGQRIVAADLLDETAIAGRTGVGDDNTVIRTLLRAVTGKANLDCQCKLLQPSSFLLQR